MFGLSATLFLTAPATGQEPKSEIVFADDFTKGSLGAGWLVDASVGNTIEPRDGFVQIDAAENTYAHLERPLGVDFVRASCGIKPGSGISWSTSLFLYWAPGDWCQIGVIPRKDGRFYACATTAGQRNEFDLARRRFDAWQHVAIELAEDGIRFMSSTDGEAWKTELLLDRPERLTGPPALLVIGKGFGLDGSQPDLDGDYGDRGPVATSLIRNVRVERTPESRLRISAAERRAREEADCDPHGAAILRAPRDPDFATVSAVFPPLAKPREVVGVPNHPYEIGIEYDGTIQLADDTDLWEQTGATAFFELGTPPVRFGSTGCTKRLLNDYLPIVVCTFEQGDLLWEQTVLGTSERLSPDADLWAAVRLKVTNRTTQPVETEVALRFLPESTEQPTLRRQLAIPAGGSSATCYKIPSPLRDRVAVEIRDAEFAEKLADVTAAWEALLNAGTRIDVPEPRVNAACRAWLAYNYLNVDKKGDLYEPHDGAGFYEEIFGYSAVLYCHALDLWGRHGDSRLVLESMLTLQKPDGLFFVRYGLPDHGALLFALSQHYRLTGDADWLRGVAPRMVRMCDWIITQRDAARQSDAQRSASTRGLIRFTPYADFQAETFNFYGDAYCCVGLELAAGILGEIGLANEAERFTTAAREYRRDILAAMDAAAFERDGMTLLPLEPDTRRILVSTNYRGGGYYGLVAGMLLESEFLPAGDRRAGWLVDTLERRRGLILGMCEFDDGIDHAYTYGYWLNCLRRDDVRRALLGFYGSLAYGMGRDTYCGVEVTQITTGEPTPTTPHLYSGTQQLRLLRMMLVQEDNDELVIGRAIPQHWLESGKRIEVRDAPTTFGPVSFTIESDLEHDRVTAYIEPPTRRPPGAIRLCLRVPEGRPIRQATIDGKPAEHISGQVLTLTPAARPIDVEVRY